MLDVRVIDGVLVGCMDDKFVCCLNGNNVDVFECKNVLDACDIEGIFVGWPERHGLTGEYYLNDLAFIIGFDHEIISFLSQMQ